jgi:hypothetical protein
MVDNTSHETTARTRSVAGEEPLGSEPSTGMVTLSRDECLGLLASQRFGRLAVAMDTPVIRPVNYVFDERSQSVVFRSADGSKFHALLLAANAAFEIDGVDPGSATGWSVIIVGVTEEITSLSEIRRLNGLGLKPWTPGRKPHWMRIRAWTVSGRRIVVGSTSSQWGSPKVST